MRKRAVPNVDQFSASEIEEVCELPFRSMEHLKRENLMPEPVIIGGRGKVAIFDFNALCIFATTGAILKVSPNITVAAKLASAIIGELVSIYGQAPHGRQIFDRLVMNNNRVSDALFDGEGNVIPLAVMSELRKMPELHTAGQIYKTDQKLLIIDGRYIFSRFNSKIKSLSHVSGRALDWAPELFIEPINRGKAIIVRQLDEIEGGYNASIESEFFDALENAATKVEINLSLPIRNALDRVHDIRMGSVGNIGGLRH